MKMYKNEKMPADNGRFCKMAAVTPQTILWEIERLSPAASVVNAATSQSAWTLVRSDESAVKKAVKILKFDVK